MFRTFIDIAGVACLAAIIAGCNGASQLIVPDLEAARNASTSQPIAATGPTKSTTAIISRPTLTPEANHSPTSETRAEVESYQPTTNFELPRPHNQLDEGEYTWDQLLARDAILPIYEPEFVSAQDAPYADDELVIGVELNGEAKAYAIGPLNSREMVNDTVGDIPILVTW
jgi:hypothetical protein